MQKLSELDTSLLYLENDRTPMHYGGVFVFSHPNARKNLQLDHLKALIQSRLADLPVLRQRLVKQAAQSDLPVWADDPEFTIDEHVHEFTLGKDDNNMQSVASAIFSAPLDPSKPLWSVTLINNLKQDKRYNKRHFALVIKVHICAADAQSGDDLLSALLQISPEPMALSSPEPWNPPPLPAESSWLENAYSSARNLPVKLTYLAKDTAALAFYSVLYEQLQRLNLPSALMSVAATPINRQVSARRELDYVAIPIETIRQLRRKFETVTTNDIVMGICAEALSLYLKEQGAELKLPMIALTPISVRSKSLEVKSGNQLNVALFSLATTESDPIKRIYQIHQAANESNHYDDAISASRLTELEPSRIAALSARGYCEFLLAQKHKPMFNLPIINIPGPQFPLFLEESELVSMQSGSPLFDGISLAISIISYNGLYHVTCTLCPGEDTQQHFTPYIERALAIISSQAKRIQLDENSDGEQHANTKAGLIEDALGLFSNLFPFSSGAPEKASSEKT